MEFLTNADQLARKIVRASLRRLGLIKPQQVKLPVPVSGDATNVERVYSEVFEQDPGYDTLDEANLPKLAYILDYAKSISGEIVDAGCGRGNALRYLNENGCSVFGLEISKSCFEQYLQDQPAVNTDIITWADAGHVYDGCVCTDVLEHIPPDQLEATLTALRQLSPSLFAGIANSSSVHGGHELHVIQEGIHWWVQQLGQHYSRLTIIVPKPEDELLWRYFQREIFFFIRCEA